MWNDLSFSLSRCRNTLLALALLGPFPALSETVVVAEREWTIPDGFVIEQVAGPELVPRPIVADFDQAGDLYVADSSGSNDDVQTQLRERPHRIVRLRDEDGDGRFDSQVVFADQMMFPEGVLCYRGSVFVAAPPQIWKLTDSDQDGVADQRDVWFDGQTLTGCANDLHGPYLGRDGWLYWCKGAFAEQTHTLVTGDPWTSRAAHVFRRRPEGGPIDVIMTGGMDNPVEVVFTDRGERIFTTTFLQHPAGGLRDGLIHAIYGGVYGKSHGVLDGHARTGELMPPMTHLGPAAPSGLAYLEMSSLGPAYAGNLLAACFNLHQVSRHVLVPDGASWRTEDAAWVSSPDLDFHPTDVLEDADGSVLIVDTGGWYKLCCPTSQLHKPDVLGGIYRVRRRDMPPLEDPRGRQLPWNQFSPSQLVERLGDARFAVRARAVDQLAQQDEVDWGALAAAMPQHTSERQRRELIWVATRSRDDDSRQVLKQGLQDASESVRQAALHGVSVRRERSLAEAVVGLLSDPAPSVRRAAAEAAGRLGNLAAVGPLVHQAVTAQGRALEHSAVYALIELRSVESLRSALRDASPQAQRVILLALDQIPGGKPQAQEVLRLVDDADRAVRETSGWILARHPEWAADMIDHWLVEWRADPDGASGRRAELEQRVAELIRLPEMQDRLMAGLAVGDAPEASQQVLLALLRRSQTEVLSESLQATLASTLRTARAEIAGDMITTLAALPRPATQHALVAELARWAERTDADPALRLQAVASLDMVPGGLSDELVQRLLRAANDPEDFAHRRWATTALARNPLTSEQMQQLLGELPQLGPIELRAVLPAFRRQASDPLGQALLAALAQSPASIVIPWEELSESLGQFSPAIRQQAQHQLATRRPTGAEQTARVETLLAELPAGDVRRGQQVFHSAKAACFTCHAMGYRGGDLGPDLTRIGRIRARRDLLEAIVYPSASFVRSFEPVSLVTRDGRVLSGIVKDERANRIVLVDGQRQAVEVDRGEIEELRPAQQSIMPSGLDQLLAEQDLADLLAFLEAAK